MAYEPGRYSFFSSVVTFFAILFFLFAPSLAHAQNGDKVASIDGALSFDAKDIPKLYVNENLNPEYVRFIEKIFPKGIFDQPVDVSHQHFMFRYCVALFEMRNYESSLACLDNIHRSVELFGDTPPTPYVFLGRPIGVNSQKPGGEFPLRVREHLLRAEVYLDLGDINRAAAEAREGLGAESSIDFAKQFNPLNQNPGRTLSRTLCEFANGIGFVFCGDKTEGWTDVAASLAVIFWLHGDNELSGNYIKELRNELGSFEAGLDKTYRTKIRAALTRAYMARKEYKYALEMANDDTSGATDIINLGLGFAFQNLTLIGSVFADQHTLLTRFQIAHARMEVGKQEDAKAYLDEILSKKEIIRGLAGIYWSVLYDRGRIAEKEGKTDEAIGLYQRAVDEIERQRSTINTENAKIGFFGNKQEVYQALIRLLFQSGRQEDAFLMGERSKSRALVDMLAGKQNFQLASADANKVRHILAQAQVGEVALNRDTSADKAVLDQVNQRGMDKGSDGKTVLRAIIDETRNLKVQAREQLAASAPELSSLISVTQVSLSEIQKSLKDDQTLLSYYYDADNLYGFLIDKQGLKAIRLERKGLEEDIRSFRESITRRDDSYKETGKALYDRIIGPLKGGIKHRKLLVAGHGAMHYLPFSALTDGQAFLLDRYELTVLPSASTLKYVGKIDTRGKSGSVLAIGNPDLGDRRYDLAYAEKEAREVAGLFDKSALLVGKDASKEKFEKFGQGFSYLHFATHGRFDAANPLDSALLLATHSITEKQNQLTIGELYSIHLNADLVTLSACETGLGKVANGDDVVGLVRGFLYAGANQIVSTLWEIDDAATESLMKDFYTRIKSGEGKAAALRGSQIGIRSKYPQPIYWAAFQITDGGDQK